MAHKTASKSRMNQLDFLPFPSLATKALTYRILKSCCIFYKESTKILKSLKSWLASRHFQTGMQRSDSANTQRHSGSCSVCIGGHFVVWQPIMNGNNSTKVLAGTC